MKMRRAFNAIVALAILTVVTVIVMGGCQKVGAGTTQEREQATTEEQQAVHLKTTPPPRIDQSQERKNLIERLERFNTDSKTSWIYLVNYGKVMAFYTVKGKVSSVNSLLTTPEQVKTGGVGQGRWAVTLASPDLDGSYGTNGDAIFFFTADGTYVEWRGDYMLCDKPLKLSTPPALVLDITGS